MPLRKLALGAVLLGGVCSGVYLLRQQEVAPHHPSGGPRMNEHQVVQLAKRTAIREGYHLKDYRELKAKFEAKDRMWSVMMDYKASSFPGSLSWIRVDDQTGKVTHYPGI